MTNPPSVPSLDVEACVRLLKRFVWASAMTPVGWSTPGVYLTKEEQALIDALASALPGMGKDSERLRTENEILRRALIAHRVDLHNGSSRPCSTCYQSAHALGIADRVPNRCALHDADAAALAARAAQPEETSADG